ncbi:hypothetical protein F383_38114 [Gossypium arboreum]|uniref:Uncharacterized protein n=1 Tax=Gossypium arboreum TaxID=29729 RepID=A0A0B0MDB4_GOSAR|nr:hypothetical protein F383_38114 [Gossypium arboreum]
MRNMSLLLNYVIIHMNELFIFVTCDKFISIWLIKLLKAYFVCFSIVL